MIKEHIHNLDKNRIKIALFSDIHFSKKYPKKILEKILENIQKNKPNYICIPGDIIDDVTVLDDDILVNKLKEFITNLAKVSPVILSYGNHDESLIKAHKGEYYNTTKFFNSLNELENVYFLDNKSITLNKVNFIGYHPEYEYYEEKEQQPSKNVNVIEKLISKEHCNVLLCHSPINILKSKLDVEYILSGHMHNGLVPPIFEKMGKNKGLVGPHYTFFPKLSRGVVMKGKTKLIITGGVRKIGRCSSYLLQMINPFYNIDIDYINI